MFILNSCQDDGLGNAKPQPKDNNSIPFNISVISLGNDHVHQLDVDTSSEEVSEIDLKRKSIVVGYESNASDTKGGVVFTNFEGELLKNIPLKYVPENIIIIER